MGRLLDEENEENERSGLEDGKLSHRNMMDPTPTAVTRCMAQQQLAKSLSSQRLTVLVPPSA